MTPAEPDLPVPHSEPAELVRRILAGDPAAEREMVERYSRGVRFVLLQLTREPARADDLYQETFRLALEKVRGGELREPDKLSPFISSLARNLFLAEVRRSGKHPEVSGELESEDAEPRDDAPGPLTRLLDKEDAALVRRLLAELEPPRDREVLFRFFVAEHAKEVICADLGLSGLHFNRVLHRARQRLKSLLESHRKQQGLLRHQRGRGPDAHSGEIERRELHLKSEERPPERGAGPWSI
jgi:RNA polymerase sigma-70 factor (ECF subfamily)